MTSSRKSAGRGLWYGLAAYVLWGSFPIYFRLYSHVPAMQVLAHRVVWAFAVLAVLTLMRTRRPRSRVTGRIAGLYAIAAVCIGLNWFVYVWAVNSGFVVETSLGYFITPLVNVLMGVVVFRERLRPVQWAAAGLAAAGVGYLTAVYGAVPWIAVTLALSFGTYGLIKKQAPLDPVRGLAIETGVLFLPSVAYLVWADASGRGAFLHTGTTADVLMMASGPVTVVPLLLFAAAVRRVPLSIIGVLQYVAPSLQFVAGVFLFAEPFPRARLVGFAIIWVALAMFAIDGLRSRRRMRPAAEPVLNEL